MPRLQVLNGKRQGAVYDVRPGVETIIGHRQSAVIPIDDPWISWDHARLFFNGEGTCWIEDLGSTNGTYVNCVRVKREVLRHEDIIFLGKTHVLFLCPAEEQEVLAGDPYAPDLGAGWPAPGAAAGPPIVHAPSSSAGHPAVVNAADLMPSSIGAFQSDSGLPPLRDPFASAGTPPPWAQPPAGKKRRDPFADSSVDPFASGPDFAHGPAAAPPPPPPTPSQMLPQAERKRRAFADTNADDDLLGMQAARGGPPGQPNRSLSLSDLNEDLGAGSAPPVHEISQLIEGYDDLDTILGDGRARTPDPAYARPTRAPHSELRTRPIDTDAARRLLAEEMAAPARAPSAQGAPTLALPAVTFAPSSAAGPPIVAAPPGPQRASPATAGTTSAPPPPPLPTLHDDADPHEVPGPDLTPPELAFERARLDDEVRRLRAALQAAREADPQAVKVAAEALRDQELGRLARKVAELERDMVRTRQELDEKQVELDRVTDEMIEKEDRIDRLEGEVRRLRGRAPAGALGESTDADLETMELP